MDMHPASFCFFLAIWYERPFRPFLWLAWSWNIHISIVHLITSNLFFQSTKKLHWFMRYRHFKITRGFQGQLHIEKKRRSFCQLSRLVAHSKMVSEKNKNCFKLLSLLRTFFEKIAKIGVVTINRILQHYVRSVFERNWNWEVPVRNDGLRGLRPKTRRGTHHCPWICMHRFTRPILFVSF
jgi:hypothetical protein